MNPLFQQIRNTPLAGNIGSLFVIQLLNYLIPLIILPIMFRALGDGGYGEFSFAQYFCTLLMFVCDYGFVYTGPQQVSQNQGNHAYLSRLYSTITGIRFGLLVICASITVGFAFVSGSNAHEKNAILLSLLGLSGNVLLPTWFLQGAQKLRAFTVLNVLFKMAQAVLIWLLIDGKEDLELACLIFFGANFLLGIAGFVMVLVVFRIRLKIPSRAEIKEQLHKGYHMFLSVFFSSIYINGTGVILGMLTNDVALGHYSAAEKIVRAVTYLFTPFTQAFFPFVSKMFVVNRQMGSLIFFRFLKLVLVLAALAAVMVFLTAHWLVYFLSDARFASSVALVQILSPIIFFGNMGNLLGNNLFMQLGWQRYTVAVMVLAAIVNTAGVYFLATVYAATGAAITLLFTEFLSPMIFLWIYRSQKKAGRL